MDDHLVASAAIRARMGDLRTTADAQRRSAKESVAELKAMTASTRATIRRSRRTIDRVNQSLATLRPWMPLAAK